jgi:hypothetical protein
MLDSSTIAGRDTPFVLPSSGPWIAPEETSEVRPVVILADRQNSFGLCLYGLMGLGLCESIPWACKHVRAVPAWYHRGCPFSSRPCLVISAKSFRAEPTTYFLQSDDAPEDNMAQSRPETVVSLRRTSIFTPTVQSARGPPLLGF